MIYHASIPATNPQLVAAVVAEIWQGDSFRFPPWPGAFIAMAGDERGTTLEVYPRSQVIVPGEGESMARPQLDEAPREHSCFHLAIASALSPEQILDIGAREGWRAVRCSRGGLFEVIELWIENSLMVEVMTQEMQRDYRAKVNLDTWRWTRQAPPAPAPV